MMSNSKYSRRDFLATLLTPVAVIAATSSCDSAKSSPSQEVADQFVQAYYVNINLEQSQKFTQALAQEKVRKQMELLSGVGQENSAERPEVTYRLASVQSEGPQEAAYVFEVAPKIADVSKTKVFVKLRQEDGKWWVTQFTERVE